MEIIRHSNVDNAIKNDEPMLALISFDSQAAHIGHIDDYMEHHILISAIGLASSDIDRYFRIVFDKEGADWTFVCPPDYNNITDKQKRITKFYNDGITAIAAFLSQINYFPDIKIPKRYRRHFDILSD